MADVPFTQVNLTALTAAIAGGVVRVDYPGGGGVTYADLNKMIALRDRMIRELKSQGNGSAPPVARHSVFRRG